MNKRKMFFGLGARGCLRFLSDKRFAEIAYQISFGKKPDLVHPRTFNEKLQWLKLNDRKKEYIAMVDKYEAKRYAAGVIGEEHIIPVLGVWDSFDAIDFESLPEQFVLKCTHDSGGLVICKDKSRLDRKACRKKINACMKRNYYNRGREWPYKNVRPRIIAEKYMMDESGYELKDYKIFNFNGKPEFIQVDYGRFQHHKRNLYDTDWNLLDLEFQYESDKKVNIPKPEMLDEMLACAEKIAKGFPFLRTDFYIAGGVVYFGEITFYPESGFGKFRPEKYDLYYGKKMKLS